MDEYKGRTVKKMFQGRYFMGQVGQCTAFAHARCKAWILHHVLSTPAQHEVA